MDRDDGNLAKEGEKGRGRKKRRKESAREDGARKRAESGIDKGSVGMRMGQKEHKGGPYPKRAP